MDKVFLNIAHHFQCKFSGEDTGILSLIFFQNIGLHCATDILQGPFFNLFNFIISRRAMIIPLEFFDLLIKSGIEKHRQNHRRGTIDRHRHRRSRRTKIKTGIQHFQIIERGDGNAGIADLAVNIRAFVGIATVQRDRIKSGRKPGRFSMFGQLFKPAIGAEWIAFASKHPGRVFILALEGKYAGGIRETAGEILQHHPAQ